MNRVAVLSIVVLIMFAAGICQADSLVITYRSGKTQTVVLDEPSVGINSWQFVGEIALQQKSQKKEDASALKLQEQVKKEPVLQTNGEGKLTEKSPEKKSGARFKWNTPISE
jgi:outer membrane biogenesis lipoprotein LolB